jgi:hypothetical protein
MSESRPASTLVVVKPTFLRSKAFYTLFVVIVFMGGLFLALAMLDNGISFLWLHRSASDLFIGTAFVVIAVLAVAGSLAIFLPAIKQLRLAISLERHGQVAEGLVIEKYLEKDKDGKRYGYIACVFNGNYLLEQNIPTSLYEQLKEGDTVKVRCLPQNPAIARLEDPHA